MADRENFGILGTPLSDGITGEYKLSTQNKIAPTPMAYAKLKQTEIAKEERNLLQSTSVLAANDGNLYANERGCSGLGELMDKEDKSHSRVKETIKRNKVRTISGISMQQSGLCSILAKSAEIPDIVPKKGRTSQGYRVLQRIYSLRGVEESSFDRKVGLPSLHQASCYSSTILFRESSTGLGYRDDQETIKNADSSKTNRTFRAHRKKQDLKAFGEANVSDYDNREDEDLNELANTGYKDLDSSAKLLSQRVQESRANSEVRSSSKKRTVGNVDYTLEESIQFSQFIQLQAIDDGLLEWAKYQIPSSFAADPAHRFETDSLKTTFIDLPEHIRQEYEASLRLYTENRKKEAEVSWNAIANAKEEEHARSRRIRQLIVKDMGSRFTEPGKPRTHEKVPDKLECDDSGAACKSSPLESPKRGEARRADKSWEPEHLLCKRLGVETGKPTLVFDSPKTKAPGSRTLLSLYGDDEEFLIHSVAPASAGVSSLSDENILTRNQPVALHGYGDFQTTDVDMFNHGAGMPSSQRLAQAIFTNEKIEGEVGQESGGNQPGEAKLRRYSETNYHDRGVHRTRAMDFF